MGEPAIADRGVNVVGVGRVELARGEAARRCNDEPRRAEVVAVGVARFARTDEGEQDLRDCPLARRFGFWFLWSAS